MTQLSYVSNAHPNVVDALYEQFRQSPESVELGWRRFFEGFEFALQSTNGSSANGMTATPGASLSEKEFNVLSLIHGYRDRAHLISDTNPLRARKDRMPSLSLGDYGLADGDLATKFVAGNELGMGAATLGDILARLKQIYCGHIGFEFAHLELKEEREWLKAKVEQPRAEDYGLSLEKKKRILEKLNGAVGFESFLAKKYIAQKRFGLEGGENTIPGIDSIISKAAQEGVKEIVIGMAHRGRLNVLANIMGKTYGYIFNEFEGNSIPDQSYGSGDVKYHMGFSSQTKTLDGKVVDLKLAPNPSHLEAVNPVVLGFARAKADILYNSNYDEILPILIHGDAAAAGQGIMYETIQMSKLEGYSTGGTIHIVINNQVGFTTDFEDARSSSYCTDVAKVVQAPVLHVNGDNPEALVFACELATEYRQRFNKDVFIDLLCYRKNGHNEGDDPEFTQPTLYKLIKVKKDPREVYTEKLIARGEIQKEMAVGMEKEFQDFLQARLDEIKQNPLPYQYQESEQAWRQLKKITTDADYEISPETGVNEKDLKTILAKMCEIPAGFTPLDKFKKRILSAQEALIAKETIDWGLAELMAYGSILLEGNDVRMSGQDVKRGTFSHRNAVIFDSQNNAQHNRLNSLAAKQGKFRIFNSLLSEYGVLGFEFGYSMATPEALIIWEAQFGDFANGAQVMIDQFIAATESKWQRMSGLCMLLPHGYEGQGPEHSSARLERFLQLCAENNMSVVNVTTPANYFHLLRRQLARPFRKPLVVMSPKKLLRFEKCISPLSDFTKGNFQEVIDDANATAAKVKRVLVCSGKVYFDLLEKKEADKREDVAIVRLEQLYPMPKKQLEALRKKYGKAEWIWVQEEPQNMGAWSHILFHLSDWGFRYVGRKATASPASGFKKVSDKELEVFVGEAFG